MSCPYEMTAYPPKEGWGRRYVFSERKAGGPAVKFGCGKCVQCRAHGVSAWTTRIMHEEKTTRQAGGASYFVTYTFNDTALTKRSSWSLSKPEHQRHLKRLRKAFPGVQIRFCMCGEYGGQGTHRPHYHYGLFMSQAIDDLEEAEPSKTGLPQWTSAKLEAIWGQGRVRVGTITIESARYIAAYVMKRAEDTDTEPLEHETIDMRTLEPVVELCAPEFGLTSRRPGIGMRWLEKYKPDLYPSGFVIADGKKRPVPPAYTRKLNPLEREDAVFRSFEKAKSAEARLLSTNQPPKRLRYPELIDGGDKILLTRKATTGRTPGASPRQIEEGEHAQRILDAAQETLVLTAQQQNEHDRNALKARKLLDEAVLKEKLQRRKRDL